MQLGRISYYYITGLELKNDERSVSILLRCLSNKISSWDTPVQCWYRPEQRHVCHMMNNVLFPRVNSQEQSPLLVSKGRFSSPEMTLVEHQRPSAGRQGTLIHPYNPTTPDRAAADEWRLYSCQLQHAAQLQRQSSTMQAPFTNTSPILLVLRYYSIIKAHNRTM